MKKKKRRTNRATYWGMAATTTWDWGFKPVPGKGGKTANFEDKEQKNND